MGCSWIWRSELGIKGLGLVAESGFWGKSSGERSRFIRDLLSGTKVIYVQMKYGKIHCFPLRFDTAFLGLSDCLGSLWGSGQVAADINGSCPVSYLR